MRFKISYSLTNDLRAGLVQLSVCAKMLSVKPAPTPRLPEVN
ncbi:hypothetical protein [Coleofasciculus chthonoplastes]